MAHQGSSSPLSSIPEEYPKHPLPRTEIRPAPAPQPPKRSLPTAAGTQNKRTRRQSKAEINLQKSYDENPLFHKPTPPTEPPPPRPSQENQPKKLTTTPQERSTRNPPKFTHWNSQKPEKSQPASTHILPRLWIESQGSRSFPAHLRAYGPLWEPPAITYLVHTSSRGWEVKTEPIEATSTLRKRMQAAEANLPYAPAMQLSSDLGWYKSKWNQAQRRENDRWGGWYDHIKMDLSLFLQSQLDDQQAEEYLPTGVQFPAAIEELASPESDPPRLIPNSLLNPWAADRSKGSLTLYAGPLTVRKSIDGKDTIEQSKITLQRFASCRLNSIIPKKAGFMFNAGAPVWSIDFLPAPELTSHPSSTDGSQQDAACDFLAVATISSDPGLVPPSEIVKQDKDAKSVVQIWSIPPAEPTNFVETTAGNPSDDDEGLPSPASPGHRGTYEPFNGQPSAAGDDSPKLLMLLAFSSQATVVRWCPRGGRKNVSTTDPTVPDPSSSQLDPLGLLSIAFLDGSVGLYSVPHPFHAEKLGHSAKGAASQSAHSNHAVILDLAPVARLMLPSTNCLTLDWGNHDGIAGGCTNGNIVIWHVEMLLKLLPSTLALTGPLFIRPTYFKQVHLAPIKSICWVRTPPIGQSGKPDLDGDPEFLASTGYDGSVKIVDSHDLAASKSLIHERGETTSLAFSPALGCLNLADSDYSVKSVFLKPRELSVSKKILVQLGLVWQVATSDFHSFIAYAAADGVCGLASLIRPQKFRSRATMWAPKVYQMDFNRHTSELRMLDNLVPQPRSQDGTSIMEAKSKPKTGGNKKGENEAASKAAEKKKVEQPAQSASAIGAYGSIVGVHCLSWNKSITRATALASGMGCGLVRVDFVEGGLNMAAANQKLTFTFEQLVAEALDVNHSADAAEDDDDD
ncbi:hypothetical protein PCASD_22823 [Puccinia coronata f. sp. avenae]|uniref:Uncharacterized protein n=1 Tax=Puccinia coronata f. sp. avenae TaxID=200324 RepID=A0A2N5SGH9_9BASI|nr:hypothetical protein PCASD_22823 [Puccinia coronata f. sp. avenae]